MISLEQIKAQLEAITCGVNSILATQQKLLQSHAAIEGQLQDIDPRGTNDEIALLVADIIAIREMAAEADRKNARALLRSPKPKGKSRR